LVSSIYIKILNSLAILLYFSVLQSSRVTGDFAVCAIGRAASHGTVRAHAYALLSLRFAAKILYGLCFLFFYA